MTREIMTNEPQLSQDDLAFFAFHSILDSADLPQRNAIRTAAALLRSDPHAKGDLEPIRWAAEQLRQVAANHDANVRSLAERVHYLLRATSPSGPPSKERYGLEERLGGGAQGVVWRAWDQTTGRNVAIKFGMGTSDTTAFQQEREIHLTLNRQGCDHIIALMDDPYWKWVKAPDEAPTTFPPNQTPYLAMELGESSVEKILYPNGRNECGHPQSPDEAARIGLHVARGLACAHGLSSGGVIHRDVKPANVLKVGNIYKLTDFGIARTVDQQKSTAAVDGTLSYMSPEQLAGHPVLASDVYALGTLLYECLVGRPPYQGKVPEVIHGVERCRPNFSDAIARTVPRPLQTLCNHCLRKYPEHRPSAADVVRYLESYLEGTVSHLPKFSVWARLREWNYRNPVGQIGMAAVVVILLVGMIVSLWQMNRAITAEGEAKRQSKRVTEERDEKDRALIHEKQAREHAFAALRSLTDEMIREELERDVVLTNQHKRFLTNIIQQYDAFALIKDQDPASHAIRAEGRTRVGLIYHRLHSFEKAEQAHREAIAIVTPLVDQFPDQGEYRWVLGVSYNNLGQLLLDLPNRSEEAKAAYEESLRHRQKLVDQFPERLDYRSELAAIHNNLATVLYKQNQVDKAEKAYRASLHQQLDLLQHDRMNFDWRRDLTNTHNNLGSLLHAAGKYQPSEEQFDQAIKILKELLQESRDNPQVRYDLARTYSNRGYLWRTTGKNKAAAAEDAYDSALGMFRQLVADFGGRPEFRRGEGTALHNRGVLRSSTGAKVLAEKDFDDAIRIRLKLAQNYPARFDFRLELATSYKSRAMLPRILKDCDEDYQHAVRVLKDLWKESPHRIETVRELVDTLNKYGHFLEFSIKNHAAAVATRQDELKFLNERWPEVQKSRKWQYDVGVTCTALARLYNRSNNIPNYQLAKPLLEQAETQLSAILNVAPNNREYRDVYREYLRVRTSTHACLLEPDEAVRTANIIRTLGWSFSTDVFDAAVAISDCCPLLEKHPSLDPAQRQQAIQFYGDQGMKFLQEAVERGFRNVNRIQENGGLVPLRSRKDFQDLVEQLNAHWVAHSTKGSYAGGGVITGWQVWDIERRKHLLRTNLAAQCAGGVVIPLHR